MSKPFEMERKFKDGEIVKVSQHNFAFEMVIIEAVECLAGWRYKLAFPKKDGTPNKRRETRFYFEKKLSNAK